MNAMPCFLAREREVLERCLPGLAAALTGHGLAALETAGGPGLAEFRRHGGAGLMIPDQHTGLGASLLDAVRLQRALGALSPSLAIATTMHHFSVASLVAADRMAGGFEWLLLEAISRDRLLLASGFSEGQAGQGILAPDLAVEARGDSLLVSGSKKPCSLAYSMDLFTASLVLPSKRDGSPCLAVALIPVKSPGLSVRPFWKSPYLVASESDEVVLERVEVPAKLVVRTDTGANDAPDVLQTIGFIWFELLMAGAYLGIASALVERALANSRLPATLRAGLTVELDAAMMAVELAAQTPFPDAEQRQEALARALVARYAAQDAIARVVPRALEALGGMAYIASAEASYLAGCTAALQFHPPTRHRAAEPLCEYYAGGLLRIV